MKRKLVTEYSLLLVSLLLITLLLCSTAKGQGVALRAVSAVNEGMAGVATGTPVDTIAALNWNPATLCAFEKSDMSFGSAIVMANAEVESSFRGMSGSTKSDTGAVPAPNMGLLVADPEKKINYGFGMFAIGGAQVNYPSDRENPILNDAVGLGRTSAKVEAFNLVPAASVQVTDRLSIGVAPTILIARLIAEPLFFGPSDTNGWGKGAGTRYIWGAGFELGAYYKCPNHINLGFCYKSQEWSEKFPYNVTLDDGTDHQTSFKLRFPAIITCGMSYDGFENTIIGIDTRYFFYGDTPGFNDVGYNDNGSIKGLGWKNIFSVSAAIQRKITDRLTIRGGYSFNENPIETENTWANIPCPLIMQHGLHMGATVEFRQEWFFTIAYAHMFKNSITGIQPSWYQYDHDSCVSTSAQADVISTGVNKTF